MERRYKNLLDNSEKVTLRENLHLWEFSLEEYNCAKALVLPFTDPTYKPASTDRNLWSIKTPKKALRSFLRTHLLRDFALYHLLFIAKENVIARIKSPLLIAINKPPQQLTIVPKYYAIPAPLFPTIPDYDKIIRIDELLTMLGFSKTLCLLTPTKGKQRNKDFKCP